MIATSPATSAITSRSAASLDLLGNPLPPPAIPQQPPASTLRPRAASSSTRIALADTPPALAMAAIENVRLFGPLVRAVAVRDWVQLGFSARGIKVAACDASGCVAAAAYVDRRIFRSYRFDGAAVAAVAQAPEPSRQMLSRTHPQQQQGEAMDQEDDQEAAAAEAASAAELLVTVDMAMLLDVLNMYGCAFVNPVPGTAPASLEAHAAAAAAGIQGAHGTLGGGQPGHASVGGVAALKLWVGDEPGAPVSMVVQEPNLTTRAALSTFDPPDAAAHLQAAALAWSAPDAVPAYRVVLAAAALRAALLDVGVHDPVTGPAATASASTTGGAGGDSDQQRASATVTSSGGDRVVAWTVDAARGVLELAARGALGSATISVPRAQCDVFEVMADDGTPVEDDSMDTGAAPPQVLVAHYPATALDVTLRALALASQVAVQALPTGILQLQCLVPVRGGGGSGSGGTGGGGARSRSDVDCILEFTVAPLVMDVGVGVGVGGASVWP
ncbi:hypothetical protein BC828DRAFT_374538 [Blastocladiella britannica]|nr:hypothetical protein BC828DRAFT_374538 [Blastocladiella britannica]